MAERARTHTKFAGLLEPMSDLEKVEAAEKVAATMTSPGWAVIVDLLETRKAKLLNGLVMHEQVRTEAAYAAALAEVRGLEGAQEAGQTVLFVGERSAKQLTEREGGS